MPNDQLTRAERIRLEALAQVRGMASITPNNVTEMLALAETVERWLRNAREDG